MQALSGTGQLERKVWQAPVMKSPEPGTGGGPGGIDPPPSEGTAEAVTRGKPGDFSLYGTRVTLRETQLLIDLARLLHFPLFTRRKQFPIICIKLATAVDGHQ